MSKKAFTLIELLVVIAIVALLISILIPALNKVKENARTVVCRTNVRSLVLGFRLYVESNDQKLLRHGIPGVDENLWMMEIRDQVGDVDKVRYCPSTKLNPQPAPYTWPNGMGSSKLTWIWPYGAEDSNGDLIPPGSVTADQAEYGSYGHNYWLYGDDDGYFVSAAEWEASAWKTTNPPGSATVPVFVDCKWVDYFARDTDICPADYDLNTDGGAGILRLLMSRHADEINIGFVDGHVETVELENLWSFKWSRIFRTTSVMTRADGSPLYQ
jgi:prepilin-type N-terminal cleavage/methylation domain-containing protein/prepilin-type processing-associated H-X9-DG protein